MKKPDTIDDYLVVLAQRPLTDKERQHFNQILRDCPKALDTYLDHCEMETWLAAGGDRVLPSEEKNAPPSTTGSPTDRTDQRGLLWVAAAVITLLGASLFFIRPPKMEFDLASVEPTDRPTAQEHYEETVANLPTTASQKRPPTNFTNVKQDADEKIDFNTQIRPILTENCIACHGPDEHGRKADLRLDTFAGATGGDFPALVPGDAAASEVSLRIHSDDPDDIMPPPESHKTLT
ncbi:MAG: c-type cytochrome domain-containing protein, partial [Verrucomicrobiota bacterium]